MILVIVTFCGHGELTKRQQVRLWLEEVVQRLIEEGADEFYLGGYGEFDSLAAEVVNRQKRNKEGVISVLILPYLNSKLDTSNYDLTEYPPIEKVPLRYAIVKRNQWMVEKADVVVAYVQYSWGGAAKTLEHARRKQRRIIQYPSLSS